MVFLPAKLGMCNGLSGEEAFGTESSRSDLRARHMVEVVPINVGTTMVKGVD